MYSFLVVCPDPNLLALSGHATNSFRGTIILEVLILRDESLPEKVGHIFCACDHALNIIAFLSQQPLAIFLRGALFLGPWGI